jgi:hypothetical protein
VETFQKKALLSAWPEEPKMPLSGACYCGAVKVQTEGDPVVVCLCHCHACRSWSGSLASCTTMYMKEQVKVEGELLEVKVPYAKGYPEAKGTFPAGYSKRKVCAKCFAGVLVQHDPTNMINVQGGVIDWGNAGFRPTMHVNYTSAIMPVNDGLPKFKDYPGAFGGTDEMVAEDAVAALCGSFKSSLARCLPAEKTGS